MNEHQPNNATSIEVLPDGPLLVHNLSQFVNAQGDALATKPTMALCRCGDSNNKPFCDGTHVAQKFSGVREIDKPLDKEKAYVGQEITLHDNRTICSHAALCVSRLPEVYSLERRPWINPDGASAEANMELARSCPSGALSYTINSERYNDGGRPQKIAIAANGPYDVTGGIALNVDKDMQPPAPDRYSLCRCGASKNKPYCDGSHHNSGFADADDEPRP